MTFDEWHTEQQKPYENEDCVHIDWERVAWNAALDAAVEAAYREMIPTGLHKSHDLAIEKVVLAIRRLKNA